MCWWIDSIGYIARGKFVVGAAKYMTNPETTWYRKMTSLHHLWFMPACLWVRDAAAPPARSAQPARALGAACQPTAPSPRSAPLQVLRDHGGVIDGSFTLNVVITGVIAVIARAVSPFLASVPQGGGQKPKSEYLNINCCYEFWKDVKAKPLHMFDQRHPVIYLPFLIVVLNFVLTLPAYGLLRAVSSSPLFRVALRA